MEPMNDTERRLQKIDKVRKEPHTVTGRLSYQNDTRIRERSTDSAR